jgi:taurine dioxygenase
VRLGRLDDSYPHQVRPVLWPHHRTGRPILAVWEQHTDALLPLDPDASTALVEDLYAHLYQPSHTYVHRWRPGDLVLWDNHAIQHGRPALGAAPRTLRRVAIGPAQDLTLFARAREAGLR